MFDSHCHLNIDPLFNDRKLHIENARENGVSLFMVPSLDIPSFKNAVKISEWFDNVYIACGIHPTENLDELELDKIMRLFEEEITDNKLVRAVGETGLDYYKYTSSSITQLTYLKAHTKLASKHGLALILHNRQATDDLLAVLDHMWNPALDNRVIFHCCSPETQLLDYAKRRSVYMGVAGDVTYDRVKQDFVKRIPMENLIIETDSPNLTPAPMRSIEKFPNKPANLKYIAEKIAEIKKESVDNIVKITTHNAKRVFAVI